MVWTWYGNHSNVESAAMGSLAVIAPLLKRMRVAEIIDQHLPVDSQAEFPHGTILSLLVSARAYSPVALSNIPEWASRTAADVLFQMPPEKMNDDRLGRSLEAFFEQRHSILSSLALHLVEEFDVPLQDLHYDPTHVTFTGAYERAKSREGVVKHDTEGLLKSVRSDDTLDPA